MTEPTAEKQARSEAEEKAQREAAEKARREAEEQTRREAAERARREAEEQARREAAERVRRDAEERARREAAERVRREAEETQIRAAEAQKIAEKARLSTEILGLTSKMNSLRGIFSNSKRKKLQVQINELREQLRKLG